MLLRVRGDVLTDETPLLLADKGCQIRSLLATPDRNLWIGFAGRGLGRLKDGRFTSFRREHGLHDDYVSQILTDGRGRLWLAGNQGISSVRIKDLDERAAGRDNPIQALVYKQKDGLLGLQASFDTSPNAFRDKDGALFFAMQSGVATLYPDAIADDPLPPKVVLDRVLANGKVVALYGAIGEALPGTNAASLFELGQAGADLHLPSGRRQVEFRFTAPAFTMPESIRFKYQLQGLDKEWIEAGARRSALYSQLAPGHYTFQVIACNRDGVWNEQGASLDVTVPPFWWETAWFRMLAALLLLGSVGGIARYWEYRKMRLKVERAEHKGAVERERARIARDLHDEIGAKLTRLSLLGAMADEDAEEEKWGCSRKAIQEMTGTAREAHRAFDEIVWSVNPRNDTVRSLSHYICKHAGEFFSGTAVTCRCRLPEAMSDQSLLPQHRYQLFLAVKEGLNNILKHACATQVEVAVTLPPGGMCVELADNGRGFDTELADRQGNGLRNMVERMKMAGGSLSLTSRPTQGTRLVFTMPIE
jgi:signal transduction histidine kinase